MGEAVKRRGRPATGEAKDRRIEVRIDGKEHEMLLALREEKTKRRPKSCEKRLDFTIYTAQILNNFVLQKI